MFRCLNCQQKLTKQSTASRHVKNCKGFVLFFTGCLSQCSVCSKVFQYKSYLKRHVKSHRKSVMDDNFVVSLAFETTDQVVSDQVVEELSC